MKYPIFSALLFLAACGGGGSGGGGNGDSDQTDTDTPADDDTTDNDPNGPCTEGAHRCLADRVTLQTCQADGTWAQDFNCPFTCYAGACVGDCGPGSQACCVRLQDGTESCSNNTINTCYGTNCSSIDGNPIVSVFVATCNDMGKLTESSVCPACTSSLGPNGTETMARCDYCSTAGGAPVPRCDSSQGCNGCPQ